jgi:hypothetical protein
MPSSGAVNAVTLAVVDMACEGTDLTLFATSSVPAGRAHDPRRPESVDAPRCRLASGSLQQVGFASRVEAMGPRERSCRACRKQASNPRLTAVVSKTRARAWISVAP